MFFYGIYPHLPLKPNSLIHLELILYTAQSRNLSTVLYSFLRTINWPVRTFPSDLKCHFTSMFDDFIGWHVLCGSLFCFTEPQPLILTVSFCCVHITCLNSWQKKALFFYYSFVKFPGLSLSTCFSRRALEKFYKTSKMFQSNFCSSCILYFSEGQMTSFCKGSSYQ